MQSVLYALILRFADMRMPHYWALFYFRVDLGVALFCYFFIEIIADVAFFQGVLLF